MRDLIRSVTFWFAVVAAILLVSGLVASVVFCDWLEAFWDWLNDGESGSATIRNLGLVLAAIIALPLAIWRGIVADKQASAAQRQAETGLEQTDTAQRSLLNERYQRGAEMLGSDVLSVRLGGIYALERLAKESPCEYHVQIMKLFCEFVRDPTKHNSIESHPDESYEEQDERMRKVRADVEGVMNAIGSRSLAGISLEQRSEGFKLYLRDANLSDLQVQYAKLSGAWLTNANLSGAELPHADLSGARLRIANMSGVKLRNADLSKTILRGANLSGADLCDADVHPPDKKAPVRGLTQAQLDESCADPGNPPKLDGVLDADTGKLLVWRGKPCKRRGS